MKRTLALPFRLLRREPGLLAIFAGASLARAALAGSAILLIRVFLGGVLGERQGVAGWAAETYGVLPALWATVGLLLVTHLGSTALTYAAQVNQQKIVKVIELGTMERLIERLLGLSVGYFDRRTHGDLIQALRHDVANLRSVALAVATIIVETLHAAGLIVAAAILSPWLALWAFILIPLAAWPIIRIARRTLGHSFGVHRKGVALFDVLLQLLRGIRIIKMYQGETVEASRTIERARWYFDELIAMERVRALARVALESLGGLSMVIVIIVGGFQVMAGELGWPELLAFLMAARAAQVPLNAINGNYLDIKRFGASVQRIDALLEERPEIGDRPDARPLAGEPSAIAARDLSFAIDGASILDGVSFEVRAGETLGIVGPSGAGKTTLLNLVARLYDPTSGAVLVDGTDARDLQIQDLQRRIAVVTQEPFLFTTSLRENIRCGRRDASDADVEAAARAAGIHDGIVAMPEGYDTVVGHGGRPLSLGEAQRVNIARAVLKNGSVLLLDEATSGLDSHAEEGVQHAIDRLASGRLTICVAHRLSTLRGATRILVLEGGRAVGLGTHEDLLEGCATYRRLWRAQRKGERPDLALVADDVFDADSSEGGER